MMFSHNQAQRLLRSAAFSIAIHLLAVPTALADPQGHPLMYAGSAAPAAAATTPVPPPSNNAPKPDACYLSSPSVWDALEASSRMVREGEVVSHQ